MRRETFPFTIVIKQTINSNDRRYHCHGWQWCAQPNERKEL